MIRKVFALLALLLAVTILSTALVAPALAQKPTVVSFSAFIFATGNSAPGEIWYTDDGAILHVRNRVSTIGVFTAFGSQVLIAIGTSSTSMDYNLKTGQGNAIRTYDFTFFEPVSYPSLKPLGIPNPYGVGTLQGICVVKTTSLWNNYAPGVSTGNMVLTHGTGDFENAKLMGDFAGAPYTVPGTTKLNIGATATGDLTFHS